MMLEMMVVMFLREYHAVEVEALKEQAAKIAEIARQLEEERRAIEKGYGK